MGWMFRCLNPNSGKRFFFFFYICPDKLWGSPSLLLIDYQGFFLGGKAAGRDV